MTPETCCGFCAKLPVVHHARTGLTSRCPVCKGLLLMDRGAGTTYRVEENGPHEKKGLFRRFWKAASSLAM